MNVSEMMGNRVNRNFFSMVEANLIKLFEQKGSSCCGLKVVQDKLGLDSDESSLTGRVKARHKDGNLVTIHIATIELAASCLLLVISW